MIDFYDNDPDDAAARLRVARGFQRLIRDLEATTIEPEQYGPPKPIWLDFPDDFVKIGQPWPISRTLLKQLGGVEEKAQQDAGPLD